MLQVESRSLLVGVLPRVSFTALTFPVLLWPSKLWAPLGCLWGPSNPGVGCSVLQVRATWAPEQKPWISTGRLPDPSVAVGWQSLHGLFQILDNSETLKTRGSITQGL